VRVIGYLQMRVVGGVVEGGGFGAQERQIRDWAGRQGHDVVRIVVDRCSAATPGSGLSGAAAAVAAGEADAVVVTSRKRLGAQPPEGVAILAVDEPQPMSAAAGRSKRDPRHRANVRSMVATWVAVLVAVLVGYGVATASIEESPSWMEGRCVSDQFEVVPCDGHEMARVLEVDPPIGCFMTASYRRQDGTWFCLQYR
jgi:hypothetical protein